MVYVGRAQLCITVFTFPPSLLCISIPICLLSLSTEHVKIHFRWELCALPAPLYKKRMYNQVQIDRAELGEEAGMRGRATYSNPPDVSPTWKPFIRTVVVRVQLRLTLFLVKKIHSGWKSDRNTAEKTDCKLLLSCLFFYFTIFLMVMVLNIHFFSGGQKQNKGRTE